MKKRLSRLESTTFASLVRRATGLPPLLVVVSYFLGIFSVFGQANDGEGCLEPQPSSCIAMSSTGACNACATAAEGVVQLDNPASCGTVHEDAIRFCYGPGNRQWFDLYGCDDCGGEDFPAKTPLFIYTHANGGRADGASVAQIWSNLSRDEDCEPIEYGAGSPKIKLLSWASIPNINRTAQYAEATDDLRTILEWIADPEVQDAYGINPSRVFIGGRSRGAILSWVEANEMQPILPFAGAYWMNPFATASWRVSLPHSDARPGMPRTHFVFNTDIDGCDGHKPEHGLLVAQMMAKYGNQVSLSYQSDLSEGLRAFLTNQSPPEALEGCNENGNFCLYKGIYNSDACGCCSDGDPCADNAPGWEENLLTPFPDTLVVGITDCGEEEVKLLFSWKRMRFPNINPLNGATIDIDSLWIRVGRALPDDPLATGDAAQHRFNNQIREIKIISPELSHSGQWTHFELPLSALCDAVDGRVLRGRDYGFQFRFAFTMDYDVDFRRARLVQHTINQHPILTPWTNETSYSTDYSDLSAPIPGPLVAGAVQAMPTNPDCLCSLVSISQPTTPLGAQIATLQVYPNPAVDELTVVSGEGIGAIHIYDLSGRLQASKSFGNGAEVNRALVDVSALPHGLYLVEVMTITGREVVKIVK